LIDARDTRGRHRTGPICLRQLRLAALKRLPHLEHATLQGRSILIVEDNPVIVMDITLAFEHSGAQLTITNILKHALLLAEHDGLSAAILDHSLGSDDSSLLRKRLTERGIPYMIYSGYPKSNDAPDDLVHLSKPASHEKIVATMEGLIRHTEDALPKK
jgi:DNA-binding response OmpR family regulator